MLVVAVIVHGLSGLVASRNPVAVLSGSVRHRRFALECLVIVERTGLTDLECRAAVFSGYPLRLESRLFHPDIVG